MKGFKDFKISSKLSLAFLLLILLMGVIGFTGYQTGRTLYEQIKHVFQVTLPELDDLLEADRDLQQLLVAERSMIFTNANSELFKGLVQEYNENLQQSAERMNKFNALAETDTEHELVAKYEAARKEWEAVSRQIVEGRIADTREGRRLAIDLSMGEAKQKFESMRVHINELEEYELEKAHQMEEEARATYMTANFTIFGVALVAIIVGIIAAALLSGSIARPLVLITQGAQRFSVGDIELSARDRKQLEKINTRQDELGETGKAYATLIEYLQEKVEIAGQIAKGNLRVAVSVSSNEDRLGGMLSDMVNSLNTILGQVNTAVDQVSSGSDQVAQASQSLSQGATEQASSLEEISSSLNEINGQARQNAENATEANALAQKAAENADHGNNQMKELVAVMERINQSSGNIKKIVKVIDDIAFQTNLLALNANVEAARAGKYGKGFAVVADEVRNLAVKSAEAVKETTQMVEESIKNIQLGGQSAEGTAKQLEEIVTASTKVADFLGEIALASKEQAQGIEQINNGLEQIDQVTQSNTASAEESASAAEELASQSQQLKGMVARFKLTEIKATGDGGTRPAVKEEWLQKLVQEELAKLQRLHRKPLPAAQTPGPIPAPAQEAHGADSSQGEETGIKPVDPKLAIKLDDDEDFGEF